MEMEGMADTRNKGGPESNERIRGMQERRRDRGKEKRAEQPRGHRRGTIRQSMRLRRQRRCRGRNFKICPAYRYEHIGTVRRGSGWPLIDCLPIRPKIDRAAWRSTTTGNRGLPERYWTMRWHWIVSFCDLFLLLFFCLSLSLSFSLFFFIVD